MGGHAWSLKFRSSFTFKELKFYELRFFSPLDSENPALNC